MSLISLSQNLFHQEISKSGSDVNLERAALYIALEEYPALNIDSYLDMLDVMAAEVLELLPLKTEFTTVIETINQYLFDHLGYVGTTFHCHNPMTSFLNDVMDLRCGNPLSLGLIYLAIARRIQFPMVGIKLPGHFLIRSLAEPDYFVDPFHQGAILTEEMCQFRLNETFKRPIELHPNYLTSMTSHQILIYLLSNLKWTYLTQGNLQKALKVSEWILLVQPENYREIRDRAILNCQLNRLDAAQADLDRYLKVMQYALSA